MPAAFILALQNLHSAWIQASSTRFAVSLGITLAFTLVARLVRGVSRSGAIAGSAICFLLFASAGPPAFLTLASVFALTWLATRFGYNRKSLLGTAERREGRTATQVAANLGVSACCAVLATWRPDSPFLIACAAALAEAAADTVSSEFGRAFSPSARLVTTGRRVQAGTNGGVTVAGTIAGIAAALAVSGVSLLGGLIPKAGFWIAAFAATAGMFTDSYLGAWFEQKGKLNNDGVNFLGTVSAAVLAAACWLLTIG